ncbi:MAG: hypothetical protein J0L66_09130 [Cytophagales bacterium]|nr:hypothetical protein [Cytophagales bacterium]
MRILLFILFSIGNGVLFAQLTIPKLEDRSNTFFANLYDSAMEGNLRIYTGKKFQEPFSKKLIEGDLYYGGDEWTEGTIGYQGEIYSKVTMRYHTFLDKLIVLRQNGNESLEVAEATVDFFILHDRKFTKLKAATGYYGIIYTGEINIVAKYYSSRHDKVVNKNMVTELEAKSKYYILKNESITQVKSKSSVLKVLVDKKVELRKYLRAQRISFSQNKEYALQIIGAEYDRLQKLK